MSILKVNTIQDKGGNTIISSDGAGVLSNINNGIKSNFILDAETEISTNVTSITENVSFSTYDKFLVNFRGETDGSNAITLQIGNSSGIHTSSNYSSVQIQYSGSTPTRTASTSASAITCTSASTGNFGLTAYMYWNSSDNFWIWHGQYHFITTGNGFTSGSQSNVSNLTQIKFSCVSNITSGKLSIFGIV